MTYRRSITVASGALLVLALAAILLVPTCGLRASSCSAGCKAAYGACYKSTQDRAKCQAQQQRCLEGCIRSKR